MTMRIEIKRETDHELRLRAGLLTIKEAAKEIGCKYRSLQRRIILQEINGPETQFGSGIRLYYQRSQMKELKEKMAVMLGQ